MERRCVQRRLSRRPAVKNVAKRKLLLLPPLLALLIIGATTPPRPPAASPPPPVVESPSVSLTFVGDVMAHVENLAGTPYRRAFARTEELLGAADLAFANFEFAIDPRKPTAGYPRFNAPPEYAEAVFSVGVNVVSAANNHSADLGVEGILQTASVLDGYGERLGIVYSGIQADAEKRYEPVLIEVNGFRVGFLAVTGFLNRGFRTDHVNIVSYTSDADRALLLRRVRDYGEKFDLFVLSYHGGVEYATEPDRRKRDFFVELVEAGVDIVWGHHPHVLQPLVIHRAGGRDRVIMYSLGNFISGQSSHIDVSLPDEEIAVRGESALIRVQFERRRSGEVELRSVEAHPLIHAPDRSGYVRVMRLDDLASVPFSPGWREFLSTRGSILTDWLRANARTGLFGVRQ